MHLFQSTLQYYFGIFNITCNVYLIYEFNGHCCKTEFWHFVLSNLTIIIIIIIIIIIHIWHNKRLNCCIVFFIRPRQNNKQSFYLFILWFVTNNSLKLVYVNIIHSNYMYKVSGLYIHLQTLFKQWANVRHEECVRLICIAIVSLLRGISFTQPFSQNIHQFCLYEPKRQ
jgi:hypothetical protein